jgi:hypothetical protein
MERHLAQLEPILAAAAHGPGPHPSARVPA